MLELLLTLFIISLLSLLSLHRHSVIQTDHLAFLNEYLLLQSKVLLDRRPEVYRQGISFNQMGHVNQGRTVYFTGHEVIIHLGNGYATYR